jgi:hypothetical protein
MVKERDQKAPKPNSVGYVYHKLGLTPREIYIGESEAQLENNFIEVKNRLEADAFAVFIKRSNRLVHIFLLSEDKTHISQRPFPGANIETFDIWKYVVDFRGPSTRTMRFLKLKSPTQVSEKN